MNDSKLKEYFHQNRPHTSDETTYLTGLSAKMNAVAEIKRLHDASIKKYRRICAVTFAAGCFVGATVIALIFLMPFTVPLMETDILTALLSSACECKTVIVIAIPVAIVSLAIGLIPYKRETNISPIK